MVCPFHDILKRDVNCAEECIKGCLGEIAYNAAVQARKVLPQPKKQEKIDPYYLPQFSPAQVEANNAAIAAKNKPKDQMYRVDHVRPNSNRDQ